MNDRKGRIIRFDKLVPRRSLLYLFLIAISCHAQFKAPTKEELQMISEPKAPGASAIYLDYEQVGDEFDNTITLYQRIKVLREGGERHATVTLLYFPDLENQPKIEARTIQPDGVIIPMSERAATLVALKTKDAQIDKIVFTLPSVQVGSILEYRIRESWKGDIDYPTWYIKQDEFARHIHFAFRHYGSYALSSVAEIPPSLHLKEEKGGWYSLDAKNVDPVPDEEWMPPLNLVTWRVIFLYTPYKSSAEFWKATGKSWAQTLKETTKPTSRLKQAAASLIASGDSETVKAKKIYAAVTAMENTDFTRQFSKAERKKLKIKAVKSLDDIWTLKRASGDALTLLFVALCRAVDLNVEPMVVADRARTVFDPAVLSLSQFDDYIAVAQLDGKEIYLDPGQKVCPFGMLYWGHMITKGLRYKGDGAEVVDLPMPDYLRTQITRVAYLSVDASGSVHGTARLVLSGQDALRWRQLALTVDATELQKQFNEWFQKSLPQGMQSDFDHFLGLNNPETTLMASMRLSGSLGTSTSKHTFLPGLFFAAGDKQPFTSTDKRLIAIDLHFPYGVHDKVIYRLPEGLVLEGNPLKTEAAWPKNAIFDIHMTSDGEVITITRDLEMGRATIPAADYSQLHAFFQKVAAADQQQVVLKHTFHGGDH
ncbi:MAG TPA: DUF3857 domain-containing protein [Terracidiphilus sp.]|nr:DUF3857 domain-containing protein [Terracidiphilus sp.]